MRILLVEDDARIAEFITKGLAQEGHVVSHQKDGVSGLNAALAEPYDVSIVDIMLPGLDGLSLIQQLRQKGCSLPVLILSARRMVEDRVRGLQAGGDDYLVKPFAFSELVARLDALLRRSQTKAEPASLMVGDLVFDLHRRRVTRGGTPVDLQPLELALLEYLMRQPGRVISKTMIMEHVWDYNFDPGTNVVEARICRLREKIERPFGGKLIHTVRGVGYVLEAQP